MKVVFNKKPNYGAGVLTRTRGDRACHAASPRATNAGLFSLGVSCKKALKHVPRSFEKISIPIAMMVLATACSSGESATGTGSSSSAGGAGGAISQGDPADVPLDGVTDAQAKDFFNGDNLFDLDLREADGLGPLYTRAGCGDCHDKGSRGPGIVQKMVVTMADGITPAVDQSALPFGHTVHPLLTAGATTPIVPPADDPSVLVTTRLGPAILGRGYMEAVLDSEIERMESEQAMRSDAIHGRINHVVYGSEANPDPTFNAYMKGDMQIGRFGLKARIATLDEFVADAMQNDMGITSPLRPTEFSNPDGLTDDTKPGVDVSADSVNDRALYMRLTAIPKRQGLTDAGRALFDAAQCSVCHVPSLKTRPDYPIPQLANIDAPVYTDLLVHDMGDALADGLSDSEAGPRDWRSAALIGLRFAKQYMHDGRAKTVADAIAMHHGAGSESVASAEAFMALSPEDQATLLAFVSSL